MKRILYIVLVCNIFTQQAYADAFSDKALRIGRTILAASDENESGASCSVIDTLSICRVYSIESVDQAVVILDQKMQVLASFINKNAYNTRN